jgi:spore coat protein SA
MSCALPVVTTPAGGIPELVRPNKDGVVTEGFEIDEYAQAIIEILDDDQLRKKIGKAGRKRVEESFSAERIVTEYEKVFEQVIGK